MNRLRSALVAALVATASLTHSGLFADTPGSLDSGIVLGRTEAPSEVVRLEQEALKLVRVRGVRHPETLGALADLAEANANLGRHARALELRQLVLQGREAVLDPKHPDILESRLDVARSLIELGRGAEGEALAASALAGSRQLFGPKSRQSSNAMALLANIYSASGRFSAALPLEEEVLKIRQEILFQGHPDTTIAMANLASTYRSLGFGDRVIELEEQILSRWTKIGDSAREQIIVAMGNLAGSLSSTGRYDKALPLQEEVLRLETKDGGDRTPAVYKAMLNLAGTYGELDRFQEARELASASVQGLSSTLGEQHELTLTAISALAAFEARLGHAKEALRLEERLLRDRRSVLGAGHPQTLGSALDLARSYTAAGRIADAVSLAAAYVDGAEALRRQPGLVADQRQRLFSPYAAGYRFFSVLEGMYGRLDDGFQLSELSKARTLLEGMAAQRADRSQTLTANERAQLESLEAKVVALSQAVVQMPDPASRLQTETRRNEAARDVAALREKLQREHPKFRVMSEVSLIERKDLSSVVPAGAVAASYVVVPGHEKSTVAAWLADADGHLRFRYLGGIEHLDELVDIVRRGNGHPAGAQKWLQEARLRVWRLPEGRGYRLLGLETRAPDGSVVVTDIAEVASFLAKHLLEPIESELRAASRWIVVPDGPLALLPFELLPFGRDGSPAVAFADIQYAQSLSVLSLALARRRDYTALEGRLPLFAMGNPQYQPPTVTIDTARRSARGPTPRGADELRELDSMWPNLPGTEDEVLGVAALFGPSARVQLREAATEDNLQRLNASGELAKYRHLLFSTHGYLSPNEPALSSVVLGLIGRAPGTDGYVTAAEWTGYDLRSDLTVLSGCDTGVGKLVGGEGVMGLPFALLAAGSVNTVLSLWPVQDEATAAFMQALFARLKAGVAPARALSETKREFLASPRSNLAAPAVWAPFILVGPG